MLSQSPLGKRAPYLAKNKAFTSRNSVSNTSAMQLQHVTPPRHASVNPKSTPPAPTLKQLRMINLQNKILEKTQAGIKAHIVDGYTSISRARGSRMSRSPHSTQKIGGPPREVNDSTLSYDEVKAMSDEHHLPCKNIYEMHAEFNSMRDIAIQELEAII